MAKRFDTHGQRVTDCCGTYSTYMDDGSAEMVLCCKRCYTEVGVGEGDGNEFRPGVTPDEYYAAAFAAEAVQEMLSLVRAAPGLKSERDEARTALAALLEGMEGFQAGRLDFMAWLDIYRGAKSSLAKMGEV